MKRGRKRKEAFCLCKKQPFLRRGETGKSRNGIHECAGHAHKEALLSRVIPPKKFDPCALGVRNSFGREFSVRHENTTVDRTRTRSLVTREDIFKTTLYIERHL